MLHPFRMALKVAKLLLAPNSTDIQATRHYFRVRAPKPFSLSQKNMHFCSVNFMQGWNRCTYRYCAS